jgi:hypothetical protein
MRTEDMHRPTILLSCAAMLLLASASPAAGQSDDRGTLDGMRACARIDDAGQRTACYDGFLRPGTAAAAPGSGSTATTAKVARRAGKPVAQDRAEVGPTTATVAAAIERAPGIYLLTMADGRQWEFVSTMRATYDPPARGATVEIRPGALGSHLLSYNDQSVVRVVRVR